MQWFLSVFRTPLKKPICESKYYTIKCMILRSLKKTYHPTPYLSANTVVQYLPSASNLRETRILNTDFTEVEWIYTLDTSFDAKLNLWGRTLRWRSREYRRRRAMSNNFVPWFSWQIWTNLKNRLSHHHISWNRCRLYILGEYLWLAIIRAEGRGVYESSF